MNARDERERQLKNLASTNAGLSEITRLYNAARGVEPGVMPEAGTLVYGTMIATILDKEFPPVSA